MCVNTVATSDLTSQIRIILLLTTLVVSNALSLTTLVVISVQALTTLVVSSAQKLTTLVVSNAQNLTTLVVSRICEPLPASVMHLTGIVV